MLSKLLFSLVLFDVNFSNALFYLPGVAPKSFNKGDQVKIIGKHIHIICADIKYLYVVYMHRMCLYTSKVNTKPLNLWGERGGLTAIICILKLRLI